MVKYRAAVLRRFGEPFRVYVLEGGEPGEGWVWLRVRATGICGRDRVVWTRGSTGSSI